MSPQSEAPQTLLEAVSYFADQDVALSSVAAPRWPDGLPTCPKCQGKAATFLPTRRLWKCKAKRYRTRLNFDSAWKHLVASRLS